jgi:translation initiation factor 2 subunit 1
METTTENIGEFFYEKRLPEINELVMTRVDTITDRGVFCSLLEYNNIEGFLQLGEVSARRMRSIYRHVRVGQHLVLSVLRVDTERGYIDLSKKYLNEADRSAGAEKYNKGKTVHNITKHVSKTQHKDLEEVYKIYVWPLYVSHEHPFDAFKTLACLKEGEQLDIWHDLPDIQIEITNEFIKLIKHQMAVQPVKIGAQIEVMCYSDGGIDTIKQALNAGLHIKQENVLTSVKIQLISSPLYLVWATALDENKGNETLRVVIDEIRQKTTDLGGIFKIIKEPSLLGQVAAN